MYLDLIGIRYCGWACFLWPESAEASFLPGPFKPDESNVIQQPHKLFHLLIFENPSSAKIDYLTIRQKFTDK